MLINEQDSSTTKVESLQLKLQAEKKLDAINILQVLESEGVIAADRLDLMKNIIRPQDMQKQSAISLLAEKKLTRKDVDGAILTEDFLCSWLAKKLDLPNYHIDPLKVDVGSVTSTMSYAFAQRNKVLPVEHDNDVVVVATVEPMLKKWSEEIARTSNKTIRFVIAKPTDIARYQIEFYNLARNVKSAEDKHDLSGGIGIQNFEQLMELGKKSNLDANDQHVVSIVDWLLQYGFDQRASDIHMEPRREAGHVRFRIDGVMHHVYDIPASVMTAVTSRIKIMGRMDVAEKRRPQDGRLKTRDEHGKEVELRLSTMPTAFGEKMVMRIFDPESTVKNYQQLGFGALEAEKWERMISKPHGIILVTGPTGSGKTTTLYSTLKQLATQEVNVCSIEDPIENIEPSFNQMQVQANLDLDFASGVRTLLRQDPDIIMVGEIRDLETAQMAIQAALTGHLVLSTLHTNDATAAITRLIELGVQPYMINATLVGVVAQRLVRTLCPHCKTPISLEENDWKEFVQPWKTSVPKKSHDADGCLECRQTGFMGRSGIYEIFEMSPEIKKLTAQNADIRDIRKVAIKEGMRPLRISGAQKVAAGETTIDEVLKVAPVGFE